MKRDDLVASLIAYKPHQLPPGDMRPAGVLVPLRPMEAASEELEVVLTRRSSDLGTHAGQVAFPGGHVEEDDVDRQATALREAQEELGIEPSSVEIVGYLDDLITVTGFHVVPVMGILAPNTVLQANPAEVARVFSVPLATLLRPSSWHQKSHAWRGSNLKSWHLYYDGEEIWGATAAVLRGLVEWLWRVSEPA